MQELDNYDYKLLYALEKNARSPLSNIAKELKISKQKVQYRQKRLEDLDYILGYYPIVDASTLGYTTYRIYFNFRNCNDKKRNEIIHFFLQLNEVAHLLTLNNIWDLGIGVTVKKITDFHKFWEKIMQYKKYIDNYHICVYSPIYHFTCTFLLPNNNDIPKTMILGSEQEVKYDDKDLRILKSLAPNIRKPIVDIAKEVNESPQFVINRIKLLEKKKVIQGYKPLINWQKLGYTYYKANITLNSFDNYNDLFKFCQSNPYIFQLDKTIGGWDLEIEIYAKDNHHFRTIMNNLESQFPNAIEKYNYFTLDKTYKTTFLGI
jgi:DNA-binding Lrp family transcriptional regulator